MNSEELKAYDLAVENHERAMARVAELEREVERQANNCLNLQQQLKDMKAQPGGVVLPERKDESKHRGTSLLAARQWNKCLDEVARLNQQPAPAGDDAERAAMDGSIVEEVIEHMDRVWSGEADEDVTLELTRRLRDFARSALAQSERVAAIGPLLTISRKILAKLQHPTEAVHAGDMWKLEEALAPFAAPSPSKQRSN